MLCFLVVFCVVTLSHQLKNPREEKVSQILGGGVLPGAVSETETLTSDLYHFESVGRCVFAKSFSEHNFSIKRLGQPF